MKKPLVSPLDRNSTKQAKEMADFYDETLGFTPNSLFTLMHRPKKRQSIFGNESGSNGKQRLYYKFNEKRDCLFVKYDNGMSIL